MLLLKKIVTYLHRFYQYFGFFFRLTLCFLILSWLFYDDLIDFQTLHLLVEEKSIFFSNFILWLGGALFLNAMRWHLLLLPLQLEISKIQTILYSCVGLFFNSVIPGSVSGDLVKVSYIIKSFPEHKKTPIFFSILMDRIIGFYALFSISFLVTLFNFNFIPAAVRPVFYFSTFFFILMTIFFFIIIYGEGFDPIKFFLQFHFPGSSFFKKVYHAALIYRDHSRNLFFAVLLGVIFQCLLLLYTLFVTSFIVGRSFDWLSICVVYPFGLLLQSVPLAPGGLGTGHAAFTTLFSMAGVEGGANIFNIIFVGQMFLNLFGLIPFIFLRSKKSRLKSSEDFSRKSI